ncbi:hypothetical protein LP416_27865 [Polaromonas sp. P2-4]|nr:hypothetical protein LP416_27865 [Polaromonas sp. P2-4]
MNKKFFENTSGIAMFVGGKLLQPGEGREFNADDLPPEHQVAQPVAEPGEPTLAERLREILAGNVASVVERLPAMAKDELETLRQLEGEGAQRVGVGRAIQAELLARARCGAGHAKRDRARRTACPSPHGPEPSHRGPGR